MILQSIDDVYNDKDIKFKKDTLFKLQITVDKAFTNKDKRMLTNLFEEWIYPHGNKNINPFNLQEIRFSDFSIEAIMRFKVKKSDVNELRLFCQDLIDIFNFDNSKIISWNIEEL